MATRTLGTNATTSLVALPFLPGYNSGMAAADVATINNSIKSALNVANPLAGGSYFTDEGVLYLPDQQGMIKINPGDYVAVDSTGWPIVISKNAIANGPWTHT
jgi:hypothetical protein